MRPTFTTGQAAPKVSTTAICRQHAEGVADVVGMELGEALGAVAALEQESVARATTSASAALRRRASPAKTSGG